jgi:hypothetical protein
MSTDVSEVCAASIILMMEAANTSFPVAQLSPLDSYTTSDPFALGSLIYLMMEAARTSEMSVDIQLRTRQYIPEDSELHTRLRENLKSHTRLTTIF